MGIGYGFYDIKNDTPLPRGYGHVMIKIGRVDFKISRFQHVTIKRSFLCLPVKYIVICSNNK